MEQARISSSAPQGTHEARAAKGAARQQDAQPGDGFALLLALLGGDAAPADPLAAVADDAPALPLQAADDPAPGPLAVLAQATSGLEPVRLQAGTLVGQTALLDGAAETAALNGTPPQGAAPAGKAALQRAAAWMGQEAGGLPAARAAVHATAGAAEPARAPGLAQAAQVPGSLPADAAGTSVAGAAERREALHAALASLAPLARIEEERAAAAPATGAVAEGLRVAGGEARGEVRGGDALSAAESRAPEAADAPAAPADAAQPGAAGAEEQLAERVAYWVHHKTQSAELTLDRDGRPVEVTVALTGDEAHVTFRSDHAEARHLLDASAAQLCDMLRGEGLNLAGVTVGTAGGGAQPGGSERGRQGARGATVQAAAPAGAGGAARGRGVTERSVDVFV